MGISGLLPALKSIQVTKHLSEYRGKTVAVDAYVWLHKGVYACATDLAIGKPTHKYVDYAMHRVRLLRHHKIEPCIVFDGGPLPAKKGTEAERKQKRDESLGKGKALLAQGKHSQARECFVKCVDVTPQMAYQFIKALRAESVPYVVAPYEADAQLAYLERTGIADAILTEDSDLLVFGCQNVLFKLDTVAATVVSISRKDFGSVAASSSDANGISLIGWSDVQFRAMTILSGCDYLPSIPGIGLKTACSLLKKWKTPEQVVKIIAMEGKKAVPPGYLKQFKLAEKCFQHQRVYCPTAERLVHLMEVGSDWDEEFDAYVGSDMDPVLAKHIAKGDYDPVTRLPMEDINPAFLPRTLKPLPVISNSPGKSAKEKGKMRQSLPSQTKPTGGILNFFGPNPVIPPRTKQTISAPAVPHHSHGKASGKRTLAEVMDQDLEQKKKHRPSPPLVKSTRSRFFHANPEEKARGIQRRHSDGIIGVAGPSRLHSQSADKENIQILADGDTDEEMVETSEPELDGSDLSLRGQFEIDPDRRMELSIDDFPDAVEQEDGYISPSPSYSKDVQDLSSPGYHSRRGSPGRDIQPTGMIPSDDEPDDDSFGAEAVSSPISVKKPNPLARRFSYQTPSRRLGVQEGGSGLSSRILVQATPTPKGGRLYPDIDEVPSPSQYRGPDLRSLLGGDGATELDDPGTGKLGRNSGGTNSGSTSPPSPSPETPDSVELIDQQVQVKAVIDVDELESEFEDEEEWRARQLETNAKAVMDGWRQKFARQPEKGKVVPSRAPDPAQALKKTPAHNHVPFGSSTKGKAFTPGARPVQSTNLKRSNALPAANITPAGRHWKVTTYIPPKSAPSKLANPTLPTLDVKGSAMAKRGLFRETTTVVTNMKTGTTSLQSHSTQQMIDLTIDDGEDIDDFVPTPKRPSSAAVSSGLGYQSTSSSERVAHFRRS